MTTSTYITVRRALWFAAALIGGVALRDVLAGRSGKDQGDYAVGYADGIAHATSNGGRALRAVPRRHEP